MLFKRGHSYSYPVVAGAFLLVAGCCLIGISQCDSDPDGDGWTSMDGDCDETNAEVHPGATEACNSVDDDCDGLTDEENACISYPWVASENYILLSKDDGSSFSAYDCNGNFFGSDEAMVNSVPFRVGPYLYNGSNMAGLPQHGTTVAAPNNNFPVNHVYLIFPGGRCADQPLYVTFNYVDGTSGSTGTANVVWDCNASSSSGSNYSVVHQGNYGGPCCDNWYWGQFTNPNPGVAVASMYIYYYDACGGSYPGQLWALTLD